MLGLVVPDDLRSEVLEATRFFPAPRRRKQRSRRPKTPSGRWWRRPTRWTTRRRSMPSRRSRCAAPSRRSSRPGSASILAIRCRRSALRGNCCRRSTWFRVPLSWRSIEASEGRRHWKQADAQIEWAKTAGMKIMGGPLLELDDRGVPDWTYLWEGDFDSLIGFMLDHVTTVVKRYRGKVHLWQVVSRMSHGRVLALTEDQRLQIAAQAITKVRELDPSTPLIASFDQPWAEYLATEQLDLAPLHFADALVRADLGPLRAGDRDHRRLPPGRDAPPLAPRLQPADRHLGPVGAAAAGDADAAQLGRRRSAGQSQDSSALERRQTTSRPRRRPPGSNGTCRCCWPSHRCR